MHLSSRIAWPEAGVVLLGDSAHNVTPQLGQGCNSALEDSALLGEALDWAAPAAGGDGNDGGGGDAAAAAVSRALARYEARRRPQVHALQRIEEENAWVRRPAAPGKEPARMTYMRVAWACTVLLLAAAHKLLGAGPDGRPRVPASLFENVMATTAPYDRLHWVIRAAPLALAAAAVALIAGGVAAGRVLLSGAAALAAQLGA
jgi:hypothetical protein